MFGICLESSQSKGMGHLFRMLNFAKYLKQENKKFLFIINDNNKTKDILKSNQISFEVVDLKDSDTNWEVEIIEKYNISYWINDRLDTDEKHTSNIKKKAVKLITFDDLGSGANLSDINICGLSFYKDKLNGKKILKGIEYLILSDEINKYRKNRNVINNILLTLGGSDTYGVTIKVLKLLKKYNIKANIHIGPSFVYHKELKKELTCDYKIITFVPSLIDEFSKYDLAITGGGITPFEANASGLPCLIIANEIFEIQNGKFLDSINSSKFIGYYKEIDESILNHLDDLNISSMSQNGMKNLDTKAVEKIFMEIIK